MTQEVDVGSVSGVVVRENPMITGFLLDHRSQRLITDYQDDYHLVKIMLCPDGRYVVVVAKDTSEHCVVGIDNDSINRQAAYNADPANWPQSAFVVDVATAYAITAWFDLQAMNQEHGAYKARAVEVIKATQLDPASITKQRAKLFAQESLDDPSIQQRREQLLKDHRLDDLSVADRRSGCLEKHRLDDATVEARRQAELKKHGLI